MWYTSKTSGSRFLQLPCSKVLPRSLKEPCQNGVCAFGSQKEKGRHTSVKHGHGLIILALGMHGKQYEGMGQ